MNSFIRGVKDFFRALWKGDLLAWFWMILVIFFVVFTIIAAITPTKDGMAIEALHQRIEVLERQRFRATYTIEHDNMCYIKYGEFVCVATNYDN